MLSSALLRDKAQNAWTYTSNSLYISTSQYIIKNRDNLTYHHLKLCFISCITKLPGRITFSYIISLYESNRTLYLWSNSLSPGCGILDYPECRSNVAHLLDSLLLMKRKPKLKLMLTQINILLKMTNMNTC